MKKTLIIFGLVYSFLAHSNEIIPLKDSFVHALGSIESNNNPQAYNKSENSVGIYQIRAKYFLDARKYDKRLRKYSHFDCFRVDISLMVITAYMNKYEQLAIKNNDFEILAKLHNGGVGWKNKTGQAKRNMEGYWQRLKHGLATRNK